MINISLPQYSVCETNPSIVTLKVDCVHWEMKSDCSFYCNEKKINVNNKICKSCDIRKPFPKAEPVFNNSPVSDLQNKLPQFNVYKAPDQNTQQMLSEQSFLEKAKAYSRAEMSQMFTGKVSQEMYDKRKALCMDCPSRSNHTPETEEIGWCKSCGCSATNKRAALSNKLWMPALECPLKKFGKEVGEGFKTTDAANSVKGIVTSVKDLFKKDK